MSDLPLPLLSPLSPSPGPMRKKPYQSKTLWVNLIVAALTLLPQTSDFIARYPIAVTLGFTLLNGVIRYFTHGKISLED